VRESGCRLTAVPRGADRCGTDIRRAPPCAAHGAGSRDGGPLPQRWEACRQDLRRQYDEARLGKCHFAAPDRNAPGTRRAPGRACVGRKARKSGRERQPSQVPACRSGTAGRIGFWLCGNSRPDTELFADPQPVGHVGGGPFAGPTISKIDSHRQRLSPDAVALVGDVLVANGETRTREPRVRKLDLRPEGAPLGRAVRSVNPGRRRTSEWCSGPGPGPELKQSAGNRLLVSKSCGPKRGKAVTLALALMHCAPLPCGNRVTAP